jgi:hypothetical protein
MHTVTSFEASAIGATELSGIMAEYLALQRVRIVRRLLVVRCGLLALVTAGIGFGFHWLPPFASWFSVGTFLALPASALIVESCRDLRLRRRLLNIPGGVTEVIAPETPVRKS